MSMVTLHSESSEDTLFGNFQKGDRESFSLIYSKYWYKLYLIAYKRLKDKEACEEIVQDLFVSLWEKRESLDIRSLENYLFRSMKYKVIDHIRAQITKNSYVEYYEAYVDQTERQTENTIALNDLAAVIETGLKTLPEKSREVFRLSRLESWPISEIAAHLNLSEKGVEYHLTKSLKTLKVYLRDFSVVAILFLLN